MTSYRITNTASGADLGVYQGRDESEALDALARDAGYADYAAACAAVGGDADELRIDALDHYQGD